MLLHLSDLHFGTQKQVCLQAIQLFCEQNSPELIVVSGDLTQRAKISQFQQCKVFLDGLGLPYLVVPGNHDISLYNLYNRFFKPFERYKNTFGEPEQIIETEHFFVIGINSIRSRYHTRGSLSSVQIERVTYALSKAPEHKIKLVVLHQPLYAAPDDPHGLKDCPTIDHDALRQWGGHGLFAVLSGHLHKAAVYDLNQVYQLGQVHPLYDIHAGTSTSYRLYKNLPNSLNSLSSSGRIACYQFDQAQQLFILKNNFT